MDMKELQSFCLSLPGTYEDVKWDVDLCFCVGKKMYAVMPLGDGPTSLSFKTTPDLFDQLTQQPGIDPAPYVARYHWIRLENLNVLEADMVKNLVRDSYDMVFAKLTKKVREQILAAQA